MNWFERYGIVGMFFVVMTGAWYYLLFPYSFQQIISHDKGSQLIFWIVGLAVLPCGYLITIFRKQMFYWRRPRFIVKLLPPQIHKGMWDRMPPGARQNIENIEEKNGFPKKCCITDVLENEAALESILAFYSRIDYLEKDHPRLADFMRKRFDVISINHGFIWVLLLSPFVAIFLNLSQWNNLDSFSWWKSFSFPFNHFMLLGLVKLLGLLFFSGYIIFLLNGSIKTFADQMIEVFARKMSYPKMDEEKKWSLNLDQLTDETKVIGWVVDSTNYIENQLKSIICHQITTDKSKEDFIRNILLHNSNISMGAKIKILLHLCKKNNWTIKNRNILAVRLPA